MRVRRRNGTLEPVNVDKIIQAIARAANGLSRVDVYEVATKTIAGLYDGISTVELDQLSITTAAGLMAIEPEYSRLAARLLSALITEEVHGQGIVSPADALRRGHELGLIHDRLRDLACPDGDWLSEVIVPARDGMFEYFGLRTVYDRYLLRHPVTRQVIETPQMFFLRVALALSRTREETARFYELLSTLKYLPGSPTLFNAGTRHEQMSSCFLLDSPADSLEGIYQRYAEVAQLSKFSGGVGIAFHRVRSKGSLIRGTNGHSNGIVPWLKTLDSSVAAVNQGGKRKGACCVYLEPWHADIESFLELRDNTGDPSRRTYHLNLAHWIPDIFMRRVAEDGLWSLFDPKEVPHFPDLYGEAFERAYTAAEAEGRFVRQVRARDLYQRMMRTLAQTGNGWMTFKDIANRTCNQTAEPGRVVHLSNLCTEILQVTGPDQIAVCNLGSINLARHVRDGQFDFEELARTVQVAVRHLDRVIDLNFYPLPSAAASNAYWRPIGLGLMGLQDVFFQLRLPFDSPEALTLSTRIQAEIYYHALATSADLAAEYGPHPGWTSTRTFHGVLHFEHWGLSDMDTPVGHTRWQALRQRIAEVGLRHSLLIAIAPTATIASIAGVYESIEPQVSNLFKRETLSGDFLQINRYLVEDLVSRGLWTESLRNRLKLTDGSVQELEEVPEDLRRLYRTAWELPQRALIDLAAARAPYIDQGQSLNLFVESPTIGRLSSMYMYAWQKGLKTTYYLRSRPATGIAKATVPVGGPPKFTEEGPTASPGTPARVCSLENPESCESCQ
jgi:ribonucleoside-diphosphate reductase alpha chain